MSRTLAFKDGDWDILPNGQPRMISDVSKAGQDVVHALSHPYQADTNFGFEFISADVPVLEQAAAKGILRRDITAAIGRLRRAQRNVPGLTDTEAISGIKSLVIERDGTGLLYSLTFGVGRLRRQDVTKAFIITNRHRNADRDR
jgi:hypothetical protein